MYVIVASLPTPQVGVISKARGNAYPGQLGPLSARQSVPTRISSISVRCGADDRQALEQLCRYITRPAVANDRVQTNAAGKVVLRLKTAWRDGTTHLVMSPLEFNAEWQLFGSQICERYVG
jgi:hypothetical protein